MVVSSFGFGLAFSADLKAAYTHCARAKRDNTTTSISSSGGIGLDAWGSFGWMSAALDHLASMAGAWLGRRIRALNLRSRVKTTDGGDTCSRPLFNDKSTCCALSARPSLASLVAC